MSTPERPPVNLDNLRAQIAQIMRVLKEHPMYAPKEQKQ
jgi:hypothetical protein